MVYYLVLLALTLSSIALWVFVKNPVIPVITALMALAGIFMGIEVVVSDWLHYVNIVIMGLSIYTAIVRAIE